MPDKKPKNPNAKQDGPVKKGSLLHQTLQIVAGEVSKHLGEKSESTKKPRPEKRT